MSFNSHIQTSLVSSDGNIHTVAWKIITKAEVETGFTDVDTNKLDVADCDVVAELCTLNHLLTQHCRLKTVSPGSIQLNVSRGIIKKMILGRKTENHRHLHVWIAVLRTRYANAPIKVSKSVISVDADSCRTKLDGAVKMQSIVQSSQGNIVITRHALERFVSFTNAQTLSSGYRLLEKELRGKIEQVDIPEKIRAYKKLRHGDDTEVWISKRGLHFNLVDSGIHRTLVTVVKPKSRSFSGMRGLMQA